MAVSNILAKYWGSGVKPRQAGGEGGGSALPRCDYGRDIKLGRGVYHEKHFMGYACVPFPDSCTIQQGLFMWIFADENRIFCHLINMVPMLPRRVCAGISGDAVDVGKWRYGRTVAGR